MIKIYGYYDSPDQPADKPASDPGLPCNCLFCNTEVHEDRVRTIGMMGMPDTNPKRSYFYRVHRDCHENASERQKTNVDQLVWNAIRVNKD